MQLTKAQFNELLNQHTGTGYMLIKMSDSTIRILDISLGKSGNWVAGLNGEKLLDKLSEITIELTDEIEGR